MVRSRDQLEDIVIIPEASETQLNQRQLEDYRDHRTSLIKWLRHLGKDPEKAEGYAYDTARQRAYKIDQFYRWLWAHEDGYTLHATPAHTDAYTKDLVYEDHSTTHKAAVQKAIKTLFKFLTHEKGRVPTGTPLRVSTRHRTSSSEPRRGC